MNPKWTIIKIVSGLSLVLVGLLLLLGALSRLAPIKVKADFTLTPTKFDVAGLEKDSSFTLTSSKSLNESTIKKVFRVSPEVKLLVNSENSEGTEFNIAPREDLDADTIYNFWIDEESNLNRPMEWAWQVKAPFQVLSSNPADKATFVPTNSTISFILNREMPKNSQDYFSISPEVSGRFDVAYDQLTFIPNGQFEPKQVYTATLKAGLPIEDSQDRLTADYTIRFETDENESSQVQDRFYFESEITEIRPDQNPIFGIYFYPQSSVNLDTNVIKFNSREEFLSAWKAHHDLDQSWAYHNDQTQLDLNGYQTVFSGTLLNEEQNGIKFIRLPEKLPEGFYLIDGTANGLQDQAWFQVTPIASMSVVSKGKSVVWLKDATSSDALAKAEVIIGGKTVGSTDDKGVLSFDTPGDLPDPRFILANGAGHELAIPIADDYGYFNTLSKSDDWQDAVTFDKTMYQPTDTVRFWAILRPRTGELGREPITVVLSSATFGNTKPTNYAKTTVEVADFGTVIGEMSFSNLEPGYYLVRFLRGDTEIASRGIDVETARKPAYRLVVEPDQLAVISGNPVKLSIKSEFFDGTPVSNLNLKVQSEYDNINIQTIKLDRNGQGTATITPSTNGKTGWAYNYISISPAVAEESDIQAEVYTLVFPAEYAFEDLSEQKAGEYDLRMRLRKLNFTKNGKKQILSDPTQYLGDPVANVSAEVKIVEIRYDKREVSREYDPINQVTVPKYTWDRVEIPTATENINSDNDGLILYTQKLESSKIYEITTTATDSANRQVSEVNYAYSPDTNQTSPSGITSISLEEIDEPENGYKINDDIEMQLVDEASQPLPITTDGFLFASGGSGIEEVKIQDSPNFSDQFNVGDIPNINIYGVWWDGKKFIESPTNGAYFDKSERELQIGVTGLEERYEPGDKVTLGVTVRDKSGNSRDAEVQAGALDEASFALNPEESDLLSEVYASQSLSIISRISHHSPLEAGAEMGCLRAGAPIKTSPGGTKPIESLRPGETIMTHDPEKPEEWQQVRVVAVRPYQTLSGYIRLNGTLEVTPNHEIMTARGWLPAAAIGYNDQILSETGWAAVTTIEDIVGQTVVYNLEVEEPHTYVAGNYLVHNAEKGGGGLREKFEDVATWQTIRTGRDGKGSLEFELPDNLTSWRLTLNAVTNDLYVGRGLEFLPVSLAFFVDATLNSTYLAGDEPTLRIRSFGEKASGQTITYTVKASFLSGGEITQTGGESVEIPLGKLPVGSYDLEIGALAGENKDAIKRNIEVLSSYLVVPTATYQKAEIGTVNASNQGGRATVLIMDQGRAQYLDDLRRLSALFGSRIDQTMVAALSEAKLRELKNQPKDERSIDWSAYQQSNGLSLFPYSDVDLTLSATVAQLDSIPDGINSGKLRTYFRESINDSKSDLSRRIRSLSGLAGLKVPVLNSLMRLMDSKDLTIGDKIFLAMGLERLGAAETARNFVLDQLVPQIDSAEPYQYLGGIDNPDEQKVLTALMAALATRLDLDQTDKLGAYALEQEPEKTLSTLEQWLYVETALEKSSTIRGNILLDTPIETINHEFSDNEPLVLSIEPVSGSPLLTIKELNGQLGLVILQDQPATAESLNATSRLEVIRSYSVDGRETTEFNDGDLVKINLSPRFGAGTMDGTYNLVDYLPSGLRVTDMSPNFINADGFNPPTVLSGGRASFVLSLGNVTPPFFYYARVINKGTFKADPPLLISDDTPSLLGVGDAQTVQIK